MTLPNSAVHERHLTLVEKPIPATAMRFPARDPISPEEHDAHDRAILGGAFAARPEQCLIFELVAGQVIVLVGRIGKNGMHYKPDVLDALDKLTRHLTGHPGRVCIQWMRYASHLHFGALVDGGRFATSELATTDCRTFLTWMCQVQTADDAARSTCKTKQTDATDDTLAALLPDEEFWERAFEGFLVYNLVEANNE